MLHENAVILFQGDSITDAGRDRETTEPNIRQGIGSGYVQHTASALLLNHYDKQLQIYNRGIGGNIVQQLEERWGDDCLKLKPDLLSVLIGINDTALANRPEQASHTPAEFDQCLRRLLDQVRHQNPAVKLVVCEPFFQSVHKEQEAWQDGFEHRRAITKTVAADLGAAFVPFQSLFEDLFKLAPVPYWLPDGVHPTLPAHRRMSDLWLETVIGKD